MATACSMLGTYFSLWRSLDCLRVHYTYIFWGACETFLKYKRCAFTFPFCVFHLSQLLNCVFFSCLRFFSQFSFHLPFLFGKRASTKHMPPSSPLVTFDVSDYAHLHAPYRDVKRSQAVSLNGNRNWVY